MSSGCNNFFLKVVTHSFVWELVKLTPANPEVISLCPWDVSCAIGCAFPSSREEDSLATDFRDSLQYF